MDIKLKKQFKVSPETIYTAWLDSEKHSLMTGGQAICSNKINGRFTAWDEYISGINKELIENRKIVQEWRTTEFNENDENSILTIELETTKEGCELTLTHSHIPEGQSNYKQGWIDHYFVPMKDYFE